MATYEEAVVHKAAAASRVTAQAGPGATWHWAIAPNQAVALDFVNANPPQGSGEACFTNRADGQVDVYYFM